MNSDASSENLQNLESPPLADLPIEPVPSVLDEAKKEEPSELSKKKKSKRRAMIFVLIFIVFLIAGATNLIAKVAYDDITLPNKRAQDLIRHVVLSLPFAPKSPRYIFEKSGLAHAELKSAAVDISAAFSSPMFSILGSNSLDLALVGTVDFHDKENNEVVLNMKVGSLFDADIKRGNNKTFFYINSFPDTLLAAYLQIPTDAFKPALSTWIEYKANELPTAARETLDDKTSVEETRKSANEVAAEIVADKSFTKKFKVTEARVEDTNTYKLVPIIDEEFLGSYMKHIPQTGKQFDAKKFLEGVKNLSIEIYVSKENYLTKKVVVSGDITFPQDVKTTLSSIVSGNNDIRFSMVFSLSRYNEDFPFEEPTGTKSYEQVAAEVIRGLTTKEGGDSSPAATRDAVRRSELISITNAVYMYAADHNGKLPGFSNKEFPKVKTCIGQSADCFDLANAGFPQTILPIYITQMPKDPVSGTHLNTGYFIYTNENGRLVASAKGEKEEITVTR